MTDIDQIEEPQLTSEIEKLKQQILELQSDLERLEREIKVAESTNSL